MRAGPGDHARKALACGDLPAASEAARRLILSAPQEPEGYFVMGLVAAETGQVSHAIPMIERALARAPADAEYLAQYARVLILVRRDGEAAAAARQALDVSSRADPRTLDTIGCVLARLGDHEASLPVFERAVAIEPANLDYRYNLAAACGFTGHTAAAEAHYETILQADPCNARVHYALSILARQTPGTNHVQRLESAIPATASSQDLVRLRYALAKELEDIGEHAGAFASIEAANKLHKNATGYDFAQDAAIFDAIEAAFGQASPLPEGHDDPEVHANLAGPIFVVGMPRTGTTLVDRILGSHRSVVSAGELQAMPLAIKQAAATRSRQVIDAETCAAAMHADPAEIGRLYMARAAHHLPSGAGADAGPKRFVDKLPANFLNVGHILRSLPGARVVCLRRHPMDTVWSNARNLFATQSAYYAYSYGLMDTARYYARFDRLMAFWDRLWPGRVLRLDYERLVADQEGETRRLLEHCGLEWDPACLAFHENAAPVATPSAAQVRRRLNAEGVGRWRRHEAGLSQVRAFLKAEGIPAD